LRDANWSVSFAAPRRRSFAWLPVTRVGLEPARLTHYWKWWRKVRLTLSGWRQNEINPERRVEA
jgi:hypothetical protein